MNRRSFRNLLGTGGVASLAAVDRTRELISGSSENKFSAWFRTTLQRGKPEFRRISLADYEDRVYGAWLGKIVGAFFGMPFEGKPENVVPNLDRFLHHFTYAPVDDDFCYGMVATYGFECYLHLSSAPFSGWPSRT